MDPTRIVPVQDYAPATLRAMVAQLEQSTHVDHLVYRESELDALWSLLDFALRRARLDGEGADQIQYLRRLHEAAREAHDLVGAEAPAAAARRLRQVVDM